MKRMSLRGAMAFPAIAPLFFQARAAHAASSRDMRGA